MHLARIEFNLKHKYLTATHVDSLFSINKRININDLYQLCKYFLI